MTTPSRPPRPPRAPEPRSPTWRGVGLWLLLLGLSIVLTRYAFAPDDGGSEITYSQFSAQLEQDNVARVEIAPESRRLEGSFRQPATIDSVSVTSFRVLLPFSDPAPLVERLEARDVPIAASANGGGWLPLLVSVLPWLLIIAVWMLIARQMRSGAGGALAFGRLGAKPVAADRPQVTFADVADANEAKEELREIIAFLKDRQRFQRLGGRMPKGVLLMGPPGTGKTLLARAVAGEAGVPFFSISGSDFVEMFVGVGASRVRDLFQTGKNNAPCIIFVDELDAVGRLRGAGMGGGHDEREQTLNQLLVELDGFESAEGVVLLAATNRPDVLDPALLRPGRFDRHIVIDLPDVRGREQILRVHARKLPLDDSVDLAEIARGTPGLSGADLANLANEAALLAGRRQQSRVTRLDFEDAKDKIMLGIERRSLVLSEQERRLTAYHEAGHALLQVLLPGQDPLHKVTIVPRGRALGVTFALPAEDRHSYTKSWVEGRLVVAYGGRVAEELVFGPDQVTTGAAQDFAQATELARRMVTEFGMSDAMGPVSAGERDTRVFLGRDFTERRDISDRTAELIDAEVRRLATEAYERARDLVQTHLDALHGLAGALLERETLNREDVLRIVRGDTPVPAAAAAAR